MLAHTGHVVDEFTYISYPVNRNLQEGDLELIKEFTKVGANPRNVAKILTDTKNANFTTKSARNLMDKAKQKVK